MKTLLTPAEVVSTAFGEGEYMPETAVSSADIAAAESRHLIPVTGHRLWQALIDGRYPDLRDDYAAPAAAMFTRVELQPLLDIRTGRFGAAAPSTSCWKPAERKQILDARRALRRRARALLHRLSDRLDECAAEIPEYDPRENILNRCSTDGGFVQIR